MDDLPASTLWWIGAGMLVILELLTGTFYLLMLALGAVAAAAALAAASAAALPVYHACGMPRRRAVPRSWRDGIHSRRTEGLAAAAAPGRARAAAEQGSRHGRIVAWVVALRVTPPGHSESSETGSSGLNR
mgnify:CR=1 FL=1